MKMDATHPEAAHYGVWLNGSFILCFGANEEDGYADIWYTNPTVVNKYDNGFIQFLKHGMSLMRVFGKVEIKRIN